MAETSSLLNCRRGNSTASSNLVLSAFEQPTAQVAGCFVAGGNAELAPTIPSAADIRFSPLLNDLVAPYGAAYRKANDYLSMIVAK